MALDGKNDGVGFDGNLFVLMAPSGKGRSFYEARQGMEMHDCHNVLYLDERCLHYRGSLEVSKGKQPELSFFEIGCVEAVKLSGIAIFRPSSNFQMRHKDCLKYPTVIKSRF